jgi:alpha-tubulin suppressor-like RCC1 family protein
MCARGVTTPVIVSSPTGYSSAPSVTISSPVVDTYCPVSFSLVTATAYAVITGGVVTSIVLTNPGSGYTSDPAVTIGSNGIGGTAIAVCYCTASGLRTNSNSGISVAGQSTSSFIKSDGTAVVTGTATYSLGIGNSASTATCLFQALCRFATLDLQPYCVKVYDSCTNKFIIDSNGFLYGCGLNNTSYQLGSAIPNAFSLTRIPIITSPVLRFSCGYGNHTSDLSAATNNFLAVTAVNGFDIRNATNLYVWGKNSYGELGSGFTSAIQTPTLRTISSMPANTYIDDIFLCNTVNNGNASSNGYHSHLLLKYTLSSGLGFADRAAGVMACGDNTSLQLSLNTATTPISSFALVMCENVQCIGFFGTGVPTTVEYLNNGATNVSAVGTSIAILTSGTYKIAIPNFDTYLSTGTTTLQINSVFLGTLASRPTAVGNNYTLATGELPDRVLSAGDVISFAGNPSSFNPARWYISKSGPVPINNISKMHVSPSDNGATCLYLTNYTGANGSRVNIVYAGGSNGVSAYGNGYINNLSYAVVSTMLYDNVVDIRLTGYADRQNNTATAVTENGSLYWWGYNVSLPTIVNGSVVSVSTPSTKSATILWHPSGMPYGPNPATYSSNSKIYKYILNSTGSSDSKSITILLKNGNIFTIGGSYPTGSSIAGIGTPETGSTGTGNWLLMMNPRKDIIDIVASSQYSSPTIHMLTSTGDIYSTGETSSGQFGNGYTSNSNNNVHKMIL